MKLKWLRRVLYIPSAWDGRLAEDNRWFYARYVNGILFVGLGDDEMEAVDAIFKDETCWLRQQLGPEDGCRLTTDELIEILELEVGRIL